MRTHTSSGRTLCGASAAPLPATAPRLPPALTTTAPGRSSAHRRRRPVGMAVGGGLDAASAAHDDAMGLKIKKKMQCCDSSVYQG